MAQVSIHTGFPAPPWRDPFTGFDGKLTFSWSQWLKAVAAVLGTANESRLALPSNYTTASATPVSSGNGLGPIQSQYTNSFLISGNIQLQNSVQDATVYCRLYRSIVGIPAAGVAPAVSDVQLTTLGGPAAAANATMAFNLYYSDKNLAAQRYWYYLTLEASAGTAKLLGTGVFSVGGVNIDEYF